MYARQAHVVVYRWKQDKWECVGGFQSAEETKTIYPLFITSDHLVTPDMAASSYPAEFARDLCQESHADTVRAGVKFAKTLQ